MIKNYLHLFQYIDLLASGFTLSLAIYVFARSPEDRLSRAFTLFSFILAGASFLDYSFRRTPFEEQALMSFLQRVSMCGWTFGFSAFLYFALVYAKKYKALKNYFTYFLIFLPSVIVSLIYLFTDLAVRGYKPMPYGNAALIGPGVAVFFLQMITYPFIALVIILIYSLRTKDPVLIKRGWLFVAATMAPTIGPAISQIILPAVFKILIPPQAILSTSVFCLLVFLAIRRYGLFPTTQQRALNAVLQTTYSPIIALDFEAKISFINTRASKLLGVDPDVVINKNISGFLKTEDYDLIKGPLLNNNKPILGHETEIILSSGQALEVIINGVLFYDADGVKMGAILNLEDISDLKATENTLKKQVLELEQMNKFMVGRELEMVDLKKQLANREEELQRTLKEKEGKEKPA
jgi:PAS domain S-box-containing protein